MGTPPPNAGFGFSSSASTPPAQSGSDVDDSLLSSPVSASLPSDDVARSGSSARKYSWRNPRPRGLSRASRRDSAADASSPASQFLQLFSASSATPPRPDDEGQLVNDHVLGRTVGYGGFSRVKEAHTIEDGAEVTRAVKVVLKGQAGADSILADLDREISIWRGLSSCQHPHLLPLLAVHETDYATYCFSPYANARTLFDAVVRGRTDSPVPLPRRLRWVYQLCCALRCLHEDLALVHRDVKPENCLLQTPPGADLADADLMLCDFGMSRFVQRCSPTAPDAAAATQDELELTGSIPYLAPEIVQGVGYRNYVYSAKQDIWSLGVTLYFVVAEDLPFRHAFLPNLQHMIAKGAWDPAPLHERVADAGPLVDLLEHCLDLDPDARWDICAVLDHPLFDDFRTDVLD
ncbi:kinase-like domain-containing protein [Dipodascopsis tothii]|uniref:kinase-like domain-containing protein n=1 Tax=Dipodascopsis tothii TaxID=44089 RepID=UPI0034D00843